jgi:CBS domain-containing protein
MPWARGLQSNGFHPEKETDMRVSEAMTRDVRLARPDQSIAEAAKLMAELDAGVLPVANEERLVGMITDRDIAIRAVAQGRAPDTPVQDVMTRDVKYCYEDEDVDAVVRNMSDIQIRRLPVMSRDKRLVGIIALGDIATTGMARKAGKALEGVSQSDKQKPQGAAER